jgi:hypothetical protein
MGYTTDFYGEIKAFPPLNEGEQKFLNAFTRTRRVVRNYPNKGKYFISDGTDCSGQTTNNILEHNTPPEGQPGLWCQWKSTKDGNIEWDGGEKFYSADEWMVYITEHFFKKNSYMQKLEPETYKKYGFQEHSLNGVIYAKGEEAGDIWKIIVKDNEVFISQGEVKREAIIINSKMPMHADMSKDEIIDLYYEAWYNLDKVNDDMAYWEEPKKMIYNPPGSDNMGQIDSNKTKNFMLK